MEFGIFNSLYLPHHLTDVDPVHAERDRLRDEVEWTKAADRAGFKYSWATEHHFLEEYSHLSANESFIGYLAGVTNRIHVGSGIFNITPPVNHPARVAERVAMLDHLSGGRFEFGVGRGSSTTEQRGFGIEDPDVTKEMVDEVLPQFARMWRETSYSFDGRFFSMPPRNVLPKPFTDPHPPIWMAAGNPSTFEKAARLGVGVLCFTMGSPEQLKPLIEVYKREIEHAEPVGDYVNDNIMVVTNMVCMENREDAFEAAVASGMNYYTSLQMHWLDNIPKPPGYPVWPDRIPEPTVEQLKKASDIGMVVIGDPDDCAKAIRRWVDIGADQLCFSPTTNNMPQDQIVKSMELFGKEVIPQFDKDPVHRTTQFRLDYEASLA